MTQDQINAEMLSLLRAIAGDVAAIKGAVFARGGSAPASGGGAPSGGAQGPAEGAVASDADLDSTHGDPLIKYDPKEKYWAGESFVGYHFSETTPDYLDATAKYLDACACMASKDADEKRRKGARYKALDAARARGWARRLRSNGGQQRPEPAPADPGDGGYGNGSDDDIPF